MIKKQDAALALEEALRAGADFAEFFFEDRHELNIRFNRDINGLSNIHVHGAGLYLIRGTCSVYAYASDTSLPSLLHLCRTAAGLLRAGITSSRPIPPFMQTNVREPNPVQIYPGASTHSEKPPCWKICTAPFCRRAAMLKILTLPTSTPIRMSSLQTAKGCGPRTGG